MSTLNRIDGVETVPSNAFKPAHCTFFHNNWARVGSCCDGGSGSFSLIVVSFISDERLLFMVFVLLVFLSFEDCCSKVGVNSSIPIKK